MLNFDFLEKSLGIVSPSHFVYDFSTKVCLMLILLTNQISLIAFTSWILGNLRIAINQAVTS